MAAEILIVDDNRKLAKSLGRNFEQLGYMVQCAANGSQALQLISQHEFQVALLDIMLGDEDGVELLEMILAQVDSLPIIMITGHATLESAIASLKLGAFDYIQKPLQFDKLLNVVENAIRMAELSAENTNLKDRISGLGTKCVSQNSSMVELFEKAKRLAATDIPVLIYGDSGTGKEVMAEFIHNNSPRRSHELFKVNCAAFPENLLDNELFGHDKGAYTGADSQFSGVFENAQDSTLLLDEIGDMALATQAKILRALQNREIRRIGGSRNIPINVRFIASTNKDLSSLIAENQFREDLYYRLNAATIYIPPLRERKDDLPLLTRHFLRELSMNRTRPIENASDKVIEIFLEHDWPGNVRELKNTVTYMAAICQGETIDTKDLPVSFGHIADRAEQQISMQDVEKEAIIKALQKTHYNKKRAAELLNISRKTLYNKLEKYGISV